MFGTTAASYKHPDISKSRHSNPMGFLLFAGSTVAQAAEGIFFKPDGTRFFIVDDDQNKVYAYDLSTAWDVNTAVQVANVSINSNVPTGVDIHFKPDGTKMFLVNSVGTVTVGTETIHEFALSTAWDITTISHTGSGTIPVLARASGLFFKPDGTRAFIAGGSTRTTTHPFFGTEITTFDSDIQQIDLSTAWDITSTISASGTLNVLSIDTDPNAVWFSSDGTKMFMAAATEDKVTRFNLSTAWDITTASNNSTTPELSLSQPNGLFFKDDGTRMYLCDPGPNMVYQIELSTAYDVTTASLNFPSIDFLTITTEATDPTDIHFKPDGTKMYIVGAAGDSVDEYNLSTPWDVGTATASQVFSISSQENKPTSLTMNPDGTKMFILGESGKDINEYALSTPFDISSASFTAASSQLKTSTGANANSPESFVFSYDGTKAFVHNRKNPALLREYSFSTGYDVSTLTSVNADAEVSIGGEYGGSHVSKDGTRFYAVQTAGVHEFAMSTPNDITTISLTAESIETDTTLQFKTTNNYQGVYMRQDQQKYFLVSSALDLVMGFLTVR